MRAYQALGVASSGLLLFAGVACGDSDGGGGGGAVGGGDTGGGGGGDAMMLEVTARENTEAGAPIRAATCAVEVAGQAPIERVTDEDGHAVFVLDGWDDTLSVTCAKWHVGAMLGLRSSDAPNGMLDVYVPVDAPAPETVTLSGRILNRTAEHRGVYIDATDGASSWFQEAADSYRLEVQKNRPFALLAVEYEVLKNEAQNGFTQHLDVWTVSKHGPLAEDTVWDIDLSKDRVEPTDLRGSLRLPENPASRLRAPDARGLLWADGERNVTVGFAAESHFTRDGRLAYGARFYDGLFDVEDVITRFGLTAGDAGASLVFIDGYPPAGAQLEQFLDLPEYLPNTSSTAFEGAKLRWSARGGQANFFIGQGVERGAMLQLSWPDGQRDITLPTLPSSGVGLTRDAVIAGRLFQIELGADGWATRYAYGPEFYLHR